MFTPWGHSQQVKEIGLGIIRVDTAGHGGYFVPPDARRMMPRAALKTFAGPGWYEEDSDWALVALSFPHLFPPEALDAARKTVAGWHSVEVCKAFNVERPEKNHLDEMHDRSEALRLGGTR